MPVLLVSGWDEPAAVGGAPADPLAAFLPKPLSRAALWQAVADLLSPCNTPYVVAAAEAG